MADEYVPTDKREGFIFHATELFSGGKNFPRDSYPMARRLEALQKICEIPEMFDLPVVGAAFERAFVAKKFAGEKSQAIDASCQALASIQCVVQTEMFMRKFAPDEVATLVYENNDNEKKMVKETHNILKQPSVIKIILAGAWTPYLPIRNIVDAPYFSYNADTSFLQVADALAFVLKKMVCKMPYVQRYTEAFMHRLLKLDESSDSASSLSQDA